MSDTALLAIAEVAAGLIGLFLVAIVFFVESGFGRMAVRRRPVEDYFRSSTRIVLVLYSIPLVLSLTLVMLPIEWGRVVFIGLAIMLISANVPTFRDVAGAARATGSRTLLVNEWAGTAGVGVLVAAPFVAGGLTPDPPDFAFSILLALGLGFVSTCVLVLSLFDVAEQEQGS